jgi:hypothetical protein
MDHALDDTGRITREVKVVSEPGPNPPIREADSGAGAGIRLLDHFGGG